MEPELIISVGGAAEVSFDFLGSVEVSGLDDYGAADIEISTPLMIELELS